MQSDQAILTGGVVLVSLGFVSAMYHPKQSKAKVFMGGVGIVIFASLIDMFGGKASQLAVAFTWLAVTAVAVNSPALTDTLAALNKAQKKK